MASNIEVNKDTLADYLVGRCPWSRKFNDSEKRICYKHETYLCRNEKHIRLELCPHDCPHFDDGTFSICQGSKCPDIRKTIKQLSR